MRRRATPTVGAEVREELAGRADASAAEWAPIGAPCAPRLVAKARRLRAGEPEEYFGWELVRLAPGVSVHGRYRLERDDSLTTLVFPYGLTPRPVPSPSKGRSQ